MNKFFLLICFLLLTSGLTNAQTFKPGIGGSGFQTVSNDAWGNDVLVYGATPVGQISTVSRPNGEVFISVPDTTPGFSLRIYKSTDFGATFSLFPTGITPGGSIIPKSKMVRSGLDSIYCSFVYQDTLYIWNVESNNFGVFSTVTVYDYDITTTSIGSLFIAVDERVDRDIRIYGSVNGGVTWPSTIYLSGTGALPKMQFSASGDTAVINYRSPVLIDTVKSRVRYVRYRESAPGVITQVGTFAEVVPDTTTYKEQYRSVLYNGIIWTFFTQGLLPNRVVKCRTSTNYGASFNPEFIVAGAAGHDNYWFDAQIYKFGTGGVDLIYYNDTAANYNLNITSSAFGSPEVFETPVKINDHPTAILSGISSIPQLTEFLDAGGDAGAVYLGDGGGPDNALYWDRLSAVTNIHNSNGIANSYELKQNYPNPFNPTTKINFSIPKEGFTTLKVFDIVGREVATLVSSKLTSGNYDIEFTGTNLASGVYFYQLVSNDFVSVKKMILMK